MTLLQLGLGGMAIIIGGILFLQLNQYRRKKQNKL